MGSSKYSSSQCNAYQKKSRAENFETVRTRYRTLKTTDRKLVIQKLKLPYYRVRMDLWPLRGPLQSPSQSTSHAVQQGLTKLTRRFLWFVDHPRSRRNSTPVSSSYRDIGRRHHHSTHAMLFGNTSDTNPAKNKRRACRHLRGKERLQPWLKHTPQWPTGRKEVTLCRRKHMNFAAGGGAKQEVQGLKATSRVKLTARWRLMPVPWNFIFLKYYM